jgi:hypothetical protein
MRGKYARDNNTMNKKTQSEQIAKLARVAGEKIVQNRAGNEAKAIINTEAPAARRKKENDSRYGKIAMHRQWTMNNEPQITERRKSTQVHIGARESKAKA